MNENSVVHFMTTIRIFKNNNNNNHNKHWKSYLKLFLYMFILYVIINMDMFYYEIAKHIFLMGHTCTISNQNFPKCLDFRMILAKLRQF